MNTKQQGDVGLGAAIAAFTKYNATVCIPLTDSQDYDLVVEGNYGLKKVQVKRCTYKRNNLFRVSLTVKGGNRSGAGKIKKFDHGNIRYGFYPHPGGGLVHSNRILLNSKHNSG